MPFDHVWRVSCARGPGRQPLPAGIGSAVVQPAWFPSRPGDRVKTDKRDARRLVALHSGGLLIAILRASGTVDASNQMAETHG